MTMRWNSSFGLGSMVGTAAALECSSSSIQSVLPSNTTVNYARLVPANSTFEVPKSNTGFPNNAFGLPALCAVSLQVQSIENTTYGFGLFLPEAWNDRFLTVGNGGFKGGINWEEMVG